MLPLQPAVVLSQVRSYPRAFLTHDIARIEECTSSRKRLPRLSASVALRHMGLQELSCWHLQTEGSAHTPAEQCDGRHMKSKMCANLSQVTGSAAVSAGEQQALEGLLAARIVRIDPKQEGLSPHANSLASRTGRRASADTVA